jgi:hypothetical protein
MQNQKQIAILDEAQIRDFESFILEIPGKFSNPILAKFSSFKRLIKEELPQSEQATDVLQEAQKAPEQEIK